jgi:hypothetical protein
MSKAITFFAKIKGFIFFHLIVLFIGYSLAFFLGALLDLKNHDAWVFLVLSIAYCCFLPISVFSSACFEKRASFITTSSGPEKNHLFIYTLMTVVAILLAYALVQLVGLLFPNSFVKTAGWGSLVFSFLHFLVMSLFAASGELRRGFSK